MKKEPARKPASFASMLQSSSFFSQPCNFPGCEKHIERDEKYCDEHRCTFINEDGLRCLEIRDLSVPNSTRCQAHNLFAVKRGLDLDEDSEVIKENLDTFAGTDSIINTDEHKKTINSQLTASQDPNSSHNQEEFLLNHPIYPLPRKFDSSVKKVTSFKIWPEAIDVSDDILYECKKLYGHKLEKSVQVTMGIYLIDRLARDPIIQETVNEQLDGTESDLDFFQKLWEAITKRLTSIL